MLKQRVAVLVSGTGTNLQALLDAEGRGEIPHGRISLVLSSRGGAYALQRAAQAGVPTAVVERRQCADQREFEQKLLAGLRAAKIDLIVLAGFMHILSADFIRHYPGQIINVHPSLIPAFCGPGMYGLRVHRAALDYGVKISGATVHFVNEITDGGQIISQRAVAVKAGDTPESLQARVLEQAEWVLLPEAVELVCRQLSQDKPQTQQEESGCKH